MKTILVTGGCGFIGSHVVRRFVHKYSDYFVVNLDKLTYAGNLRNLVDVENSPNYEFVQGDIVSEETVQALFERYLFSSVIHLAAESHVDRSIEGPTQFVITNVLGTTNLLSVARNFWANETEDKTFYHVSTDEVYGTLGESGLFVEDSPYAPRSPYAASKAASDHMVRAFGETFGLPIIISNCSNNYGPYQFPEKLIPTCICRLLDGMPIPVYGTGENIRDWLHVEDHVQAIDLLLHSGHKQASYNIGGDCEVPNLKLVQHLCDIYDELKGQQIGHSRTQISFVPDRLGHDFRYAVDCSKLKREFSWSQQSKLETGLRATVQWYLANTDWLEGIRSGSYRQGGI